MQKTTSILKPPSSDILIDHSLMTDMTGNDAAEYTLSSVWVGHSNELIVVVFASDRSAEYQVPL